MLCYCLVAGSFSGLPVTEIHLVEPDGVIRHVSVPVLLVVDRDAVPAGITWIPVNVQGRGLPIESDGFEEQTAARRPLDLEHNMIPAIIVRVAGNSGRHPLLVHVVISIPLVPAGNAALVTPDERLPTNKLVDVEFQSLRVSETLGIKIRFVHKVVQLGNQGVVTVGDALRRKISDDVIVPQNVGKFDRAPDVMSCGTAANRR